MTDLHGNEPVVFDFTTAGSIVSAANAAADTLSSQSPTRASAVATGHTEFRGYYADLFHNNAETARGDAIQLHQGLKDLAKLAHDLSTAASEENDRRSKARDWYKKHDSIGDHIRDFAGGLFGHGAGKPPSDPNPAPVPEPIAIPMPKERKISGHGPSGGVSSASPHNLRSFANTLSNLQPFNVDHHSTLVSLVHTFNAHTKWGSIEADALLKAFGTWNDQNHNDVRWARTLADSFEAAGSNGSFTVPDSALGASLAKAGVTASRQDLDVTVPETKGFVLTTGYALDPVNTATGNFIEPETDLAATGAAALALSRMYNSFSTEPGAFGIGWSSLADAGLEIGEESATFTLADGRAVVFPRVGDGWAQPASDAMWLAEADGEVDGERAGEVTGGAAAHRITDNDGSWWLFDAGRLTSYGSGPGTTVTLEYAEGRLAAIRHERGRSITVTWDGDRVAAATCSDGRTAAYTYDDEGLLTSVTTAAGTRRYGWDTAARVITTVHDADGVLEVENTYDEHRRVVRQLTQHGREVRFTYLPGNVTLIDDRDGTNANTWIADGHARLIGVIDSDDRRQSMAYDRHSNLVAITERDGSTTVHEYDARSRRIRTVTPSGADLRFGYDELDRVTSVVTEAGAVTTMTYDGAERQPATITDPEGGVTRLTWTQGLLKRIVGPTGITAAFEHDEHDNLISATDPDGNTARLEHDACGRITAAVTPLGHRTEYYYDAAGRLARRIDPDGAQWRFEHTAAGRLAATIDPTGARTTLEYDEAGEHAHLIDPLGRRVTFAHDVFGNLTSTTLPDGRRWEFTYDSLSRRTATVSPDGAVWRTTFDHNGVPTGSTDPTGVTTTVRTDRRRGTVEASTAAGTSTYALDPLGRPTVAVAPDGAETVRVYDRCGRVVESVDAEGGLTRLRYDASGRLVALTSPSGAVTSYEWDRCGRLAATVAPGGARTTYAYDADRRLTRVTLPTGEAAELTYDACGRVVARRVPGVGSSRITYDATGRIIEQRDPLNGRRRFRYDAAGRLVEAIDGNGGSTLFERDALGRVVAITNPLGAVTRRVFDSLDRCLSETDALGRTTTAGYDAAGRQVWQQNPDGRRIEMAYDAAGRLARVSVDGVVRSTLERDTRRHRLTVVDHTDGSRTCRHELAWNGRRQLISRARDGRAVTWSYDADGRRAAMTTPDGNTTSYSYDAHGALSAVDHPLLGRATFDHDPSGRLVAAAAGDVMQTWEYADGFVVAHTRTTPEGSSRTRITRSDSGRIDAVDRDGEVTTFGYDEACQMIAAVTGGRELRWRYDAAGRLVAESDAGVVTEHAYDAAGQLLSTTSPARGATYAYDAAGRRTSATVDGATTTYTWDAMGWLAGIADDTGVEHALHVDALGELAVVDGTELFHDSAAWGRGPVQAGGIDVLAAGAFTGVGSGWAAPGWRTARDTDPTDPWSPPRPVVAGLPAGLGIGTGGELVVAGLEWMNARVYDPASRGFLSTDPLDSVVGSGWAGNPYSYAGNDPLHALDPLGLRPATDEDLQKWANAHSNTWAYLAAGVAIGAGVFLIATAPFDGPLGPALGGALIGGGVSAIQAKAEGDDFTKVSTWAKVGIGAGVGALGGGLGDVAESAVETKVETMVANQVIDAASRTTVEMGMKMAANVGVDAGTGGIENAAYYTQEAMSGEHGFSVGGLLGTTGAGMLAGGIGGFAGSSTVGVGAELAHESGRRVLATTLSTGEGAISGSMSGLINSGIQGENPAGEASSNTVKDGLASGASGYHSNFRVH